MKSIYLIRHAKSSWDHPYLSDRDRPLNKRGYRDAPRMARHIGSLIEKPEILICSPSNRTNETAEAFLKVFNLPAEQMMQEEELYHAGIRNFVNVLSQLDDQCSTAMLFSHNPGITEFVNQLSDSSFDNIPTCGVAAISVDIDEWRDFSGLGGKLDFYYYPKGLKTNK